MKPFATFCTALVLAAAPLAASHAADPELSKQHSACLAKAAATTDMVECITAENKRQDARLNTVYNALMATLSTARKTQLRDAQRAWLKYRDANCAFYFDPDGGTMARVAANDCVLSATADRAVELERLKTPN